MTLRILVANLIMLLMCACSQHEGNERLQYIAELASDYPEEALSCLGSINPGELSENDLHYYYFLTIKASDKAAIHYKSDSLICKIIEFYSSHKDEDIYPEVLYYGARAYRAQGDNLTAMHYFQLALSELSDDKRFLNLRHEIASQYGECLSAIKLYDRALSVIKSAIEISREMKDTSAFISYQILLAATLIQAEKLHSAESVLLSILRNYPSISPTERANAKMYLGVVYRKQRKMDSAISYLREAPHYVSKTMKHCALAHTAYTYLEIGQSDSAYHYANQLINGDDTSYRQAGFDILLAPELRNNIHSDSLDRYISDYRELVNNFYDKNDAQVAINQQNLYNYQKQEHSRLEKMHTNGIQKWRIGGLGLLGGIFIIGLIMLVLKIKNKNYVKALQHDNNNSSEEIAPKIKSESINAGLYCLADQSIVQDLREQLKNELLSKLDSASSYIVPMEILQSEPYGQIKQYIVADQVVREDAAVWGELERVVIECAPKFKYNLNLLTKGKMSARDFQTALLIKCGVKPSEIVILFGVSNGAIISRRETLCVKVFGRKVGVKTIDSIIRLL